MGGIFIVMKYIITEKQLRLIENLDLKSRAGKQEKQREEYVNKLISKGIENLDSQERLILLEFGKIDLLFNKVLEDVKIMLQYWDYDTLSSNIIFNLGNTKIVLFVNKVLGHFTIKRFTINPNKSEIITSTKSEFATTYQDMISKLMNLLKEGDITNE